MKVDYRVIGIDVSTKTGVVILTASGEVLEKMVVSCKPSQNRLERGATIAASVSRFVKAYKVDFAVIEGYGYANAHTLALLVEIGTLVRYFLGCLEIPYFEVPPTSLKKFVTGQGNAKKDVMLLEVYKRFGFETKDDNIADAFCLAQIGRALLGVKTVPLRHLEALEVVKKSQPHICSQLQI